jgi:tripartite-type tricarboxylate transporter receptor subunit TctC
MKYIFRIAPASGFLLATISMIFVASAAQAADYPSKSVRMIVGFAPGGASDLGARILAQKLTQSLGQQVVVDNRAGAGGNLGHELVAKATPDGYTILWCSIGPMAVNVSLFAKLPYDPLRDFEPITIAADSINALVVHPSVAATSVLEFIALAKAQPGKLNYGSSGYGGAGHLSGELFNLMAGVKIAHVPYKGGGPAMLDLIGGQIQAIFATLPTALPHMRTGKIRGLAVVTAKRAPALPELPTIAEAGVPGYAASNWYGLAAPAGTPKPILAKLHREIVNAIESPDVKEAYSVQGIIPLTSTPQEFRAFIKAEIDKWGALIKKIGLKPN